VEARSSDAWPVALSHSSLMIPPHTARPLTITLSIPPAASLGLRDTLTITATSALSATVQSSAIDTTIVVPWSVYLPRVRRN
jgi:hypothetical protein